MTSTSASSCDGYPSLPFSLCGRWCSGKDAPLLEKDDEGERSATGSAVASGALRCCWD
eukprot:CAMPEP_0176426436 /NCGR_PEP_ID=MMETSP0127-20121128/11943_1 /TAXON_ID=938130 /ORGANISM="Platyophrya macrostoma, Strain WH" /LENGTH=57 /DNA_ID=CAMNT_0017807707 /DNA_START=68 /DNA_END=241 /DNA_ORIENTATION=-